MDRGDPECRTNTESLECGIISGAKTHVSASFNSNHQPLEKEFGVMEKLLARPAEIQCEPS